MSRFFCTFLVMAVVVLLAGCGGGVSAKDTSQTITYKALVGRWVNTSLASPVQLTIVENQGSAVLTSAKYQSYYFSKPLLDGGLATTTGTGMNFYPSSSQVAGFRIDVDKNEPTRLKCKVYRHEWDSDGYPVAPYECLLSRLPQE